MYVDKVHLYCDQCENDTIIESEEELEKLEFKGKRLGLDLHHLREVQVEVSCPMCDDGRRLHEANN